MNGNYFVRSNITTCAYGFHETPSNLSIRFLRKWNDTEYGDVFFAGFANHSFAFVCENWKRLWSNWRSEKAATAAWRLIWLFIITNSLSIVLLALNQIVDCYFHFSHRSRFKRQKFFVCFSPAEKIIVSLRWECGIHSVNCKYVYEARIECRKFSGKLLCVLL